MLETAYEEEEEREEEAESLSPPPTEMSGLASLLQPTEALRILEQEASTLHEKEVVQTEDDCTFQVEDVAQELTSNQ